MKNYYENNIRIIDDYMKKSMENISTPLLEAMEYSLFSSGKRLRPLIMLMISRELNIDDEKILPYCAAIEMIHTYSLIHDDLPCLDNDDLRRGKPTCHKIFGEANALLAGDALLNFAYELLFENCTTIEEISAAKLLAKHAGVNGMIGGQVMDILAESMPITKDQLNYIHENKTGKLLTASFVIPFILAKSSKETIEEMYKAGMDYGISFQILDDILDVTSTDEVLGKPVGSDEKNNKSTYVTMYGLDKSKSDYESLKSNCLETLGNNVSKQSEIFEFIYETFDRKY